MPKNQANNSSLPSTQPRFIQNTNFTSPIGWFFFFVGFRLTQARITYFDKVLPPNGNITSLLPGAIANAFFYYLPPALYGYFYFFKT